jgi:hypothetical protein
MSSNPNGPRWNILSLVTAVIEVAVIAASYFLFWHTYGIFIIFFGVWFCLFVSLLGVLLAVVSLVRRERWLIISRLLKNALKF